VRSWFMAQRNQPWIHVLCRRGGGGSWSTARVNQKIWKRTNESPNGLRPMDFVCPTCGLGEGLFKKWELELHIQSHQSLVVPPPPEFTVRCSHVQMLARSDARTLSIVGKYRCTQCGLSTRVTSDSPREESRSRLRSLKSNAEGSSRCGSRGSCGRNRFRRGGSGKSAVVRQNLLPV
jgi:rubredoxin